MRWDWLIRIILKSIKNLTNSKYSNGKEKNRNRSNSGWENQKGHVQEKKDGTLKKGDLAFKIDWGINWAQSLLWQWQVTHRIL